MISGEGIAFRSQSKSASLLQGAALEFAFSQKLALQCEPVPIPVLHGMGFHGDLAIVRGRLLPVCGGCRS